MEPRYFDYNATTPLCPEAKAAWEEAVAGAWMNPSSPYRAAASVHAKLERARASVAEYFGVSPERIVFNGGATEGNNAVFQHWAGSLPEGSRVGVSPTEHPSVLEAARLHFGDRIVWLGLDADGAVDPAGIPFDELAALSVMAANNETGVLNPWREIAAAAAESGVTFHCDASQWIGKMPPDGLGECAFVTACAHKFGGPRGVGFWILPDRCPDFHALAGGEQEAGRRAGTEDVPGVLAMAAALAAVEFGLPEGRDAFLEELPELKLIGAGAPRLWNTAMCILPEFANTRWIRGLERHGFLVSSGSACATGKPGPSHVLSAMGVSLAEADRAVRISAGPAASVQDWRDLAEAVCLVGNELRADADSGSGRVIDV